MESRTPAPGDDVMARWRGMTLTRDAANRVWLQEPGGDKLLIFSRRAYYHFATFLAPDRILIAGPIDDKPDSAISTHHQWVVDRSGELKYKLPSFYANITDYYAVNRDGTRFAVRDAIESKAEVLGNVLSLGAEHNSPFNAGRVRVFAASDGRQLFEYKWGLGRYEHDASRRIALSDDGSLLALLDGFRLLIFQLPSQ
jgi:hypothetical protein